MAVRVPGEDETSFIISAIDATAAGIESAKAGIRGLSSATDDFEKRSKAQLDRMQRHWIAWSAGIYAAISTLQQAWKYAEQAAAFEEQQANLGALAARYNLTADAATNMAKEAVGGQLSMVEASQEAAKAFQMGFNPQQMAAFLTEAEKLTDVVGGEIPAAVEAMERAAATGRSRGLVTYGIIIDLNKALEEYAKQHGISKDAIDAHTAMQIRAKAILEEARKKTSALAGAAASTADKMNVLRATVKDIELWLGQSIIRAAAAGMGVLQGLAAAALAAYAGLSGLAFVVSTLTFQNAKAAENYANMKAALAAAADLTNKMANNITTAFSSARALASVMKSNAAIEGAVPLGGGGGGAVSGKVKADALKQIKAVEEAWQASFPFAEQLGRTYMESVTGGMTEILPEIATDRLNLNQSMLDAEYAQEMANAERKLALWQELGEMGFAYAQNMSTLSMQLLLAEGDERENIERRMLATTIRMLTQGLQAFMFMKAKEHLANALAAAGMVQTRAIQASSEMSIGAAMAAAWAAYYAAHAANPYGGQAYIPAATAMAAAVVGFGVAGSAIQSIGAAAIAAELAQAAAWAAGGMLVGGLGEAMAQKIEQGGGSGNSKSTSYTYGATGETPIITETQTTAARSIQVNVVVNGSFFGNKDELAREIATEIKKAEADGVH